MKAMTTWTKSTALFCSLFIVVLSVLSSVTTAFMELAPVDIDNLNDTQYHCIAIGPQPRLTVFTVFRMGLTYFIPLMTMTVLYSLTIKQLTNMKLQHLQSERTIESRRKVVNMLIVMVVIFAVSWLPHTIISCLITADYRVVIGSNRLVKILPVSAFLIYFNCIMNPFLYSFMSSQYRQGFKTMFAQCCCSLRARKSFSITSTTGSEIKSIETN